MVKRQIASLGFLMVLSLTGCSQSATNSVLPETIAVAEEVRGSGAWQTGWEKTVAEAKKEGTVVVLTSSGAETRSLVARGFKERYGINVEFIAGQGAEVARKILAERRTGLFLSDVYVSGSTTLTTQLKPAGVLDPLPPALKLPEVTDPGAWYGGRIYFSDHEKRYVLPFILYVSRSIFANAAQTRPEEIVSYKDLLAPKWKGKIAIGDPTIAGSGLRWFSVVTSQLIDMDFHRQLAAQEPAILRDERMVTEWVARGKYAIGIGVKPDVVSEFIRAGADLKYITPSEGTWLTAGAGVLGAINRPAHPAAQIVFINWLLSKEGQTLYSQATLTQSAREDIPTHFLPPERVRQPGVTYFVSEDEEFQKKDREFTGVAKEIYGHLIK